MKPSVERVDQPGLIEGKQSGKNEFSQTVDPLIKWSSTRLYRKEKYLHFLTYYWPATLKTLATGPTQSYLYIKDH